MRKIERVKTSLLLLFIHKEKFITSFTSNAQGACSKANYRGRRLTKPAGERKLESKAGWGTKEKKENRNERRDEEQISRKQSWLKNRRWKRSEGREEEREERRRIRGKKSYTKGGRGRGTGRSHFRVPPGFPPTPIVAGLGGQVPKPKRGRLRSLRILLQTARRALSPVRLKRRRIFGSLLHQPQHDV